MILKFLRVRKLFWALGDSDKSARVAAARQLASLGGPNWEKAVDGYRINTRELVGSGDRRAVISLLRYLSHKEYVCRHDAAEALGELGSRKAVPSLIKALDDRTEMVRVAVCEALGQIGDGRAARPLHCLARGPDMRIASHATKAIGGLSAKHGLGPLVAILRDDKRSQVRIAAAMMLRKFEGPRAVDALCMALSKDTDAGVRSRAAFSLGLMKDMRAASALKEATGDPESKVCNSALAALGSLGLDPLTMKERK